MELNTDEPRMIFPFHNLGQPPIGRHAGEFQPSRFQLFAVFDINLIPVAVPLFDCRTAINLGHFRPFGEGRVIRPKAHGAALVVIRLAFHLVIALNPFLQMVHHGFKTLLSGFMVKFL